MPVDQDRMSCDQTPQERVAQEHILPPAGATLIFSSINIKYVEQAQNHAFGSSICNCWSSVHHDIFMYSLVNI